MDNGLKISITLGLSLITLPVGAVPLSSQTTTFSGTVPVTCNVSGGSTNVNLVLTGLNNLQGGGSNVSFEANANVDLQLGAIGVTATPTGTSSYSWVAELRDAGNNVIASSDKSNASSLVNYSSGLTSSTTFTVWMNIAPNTGFFKPGTYTGAVTLDCLAH